MKGLDLDKLKDKNFKILSIEEALKDVEPFFSGEELDKFLKRVSKRKSNPELRHMPNDNDIKVVNENFKDLEHEVYSNIPTEED